MHQDARLASRILQASCEWHDPWLAKETLSEFMERYNNEVDDIMCMMCYQTLVNKRVAENLR